MEAMLQKQEDVFYYLTAMNENYAHPAMPEGVEEGILRGMYRFRESQAKSKLRVQLLGSGAILREVIAAAELLENDWKIAADVWSVTSFTELRRDGLETDREHAVDSTAKRQSWVESCLGPSSGPVVAASDYVRAVADLIRTWVPRRYVTLGTDGFGRSDTRAQLRKFFGVDQLSIAFSAMKALVDDGAVERSTLEQFKKKYSFTPAPSPWNT
jgi:pyruvate dehydrogenase E1 component